MLELKQSTVGVVSMPGERAGSGQSRENIDCGESNPTAPELHTRTCIPECTLPFCSGSPLRVFILEFGRGSWRLERFGWEEIGAGRSLGPGGAWGREEPGAGRSCLELGGAQGWEELKAERSCLGPGGAA